MPDSRLWETPRIVTWQEMQNALLPYIAGYSWAMDTIGDLWRLCTPTPNQVLIPGGWPGETRIVSPNDFRAWWADVAKKQSLEISAAEVVLPGRQYG